MHETATPSAIESLGLIHTVRLSQRDDLPLVVLVHGRAGTSQVMWTFERCLPERSTVVSLQAPIPDPRGGFSWWQVVEVDECLRTRAADPNELRQSAEHLAEAVRRIPRVYSIAPPKIIAIGFSQGAALLSVVMEAGALPLDGVGLLAGFVPDSLRRPVRLPPVFIGHGTEDEVVSLDTARRGAERLREWGAEVEFVTDKVKHKVGVEAMRKLKEWVHRIAV